MLPWLRACRISAGISRRAGLIADRDHLQAEPMQLLSGVGTDIAEALDHGHRIPEINVKLIHHPPG
jgi:hypothetical protein